MNVMCCGCRRFLGPDGKLVMPDGFSKGESTFFYDGKIIRMPRGDRLGNFAHASAAEDAARNAGWSVQKDKGGSLNNHRCLECSKKETAERERVGHHPGREAGAWSGAVLIVDRELGLARRVG